MGKRRKGREIVLQSCYASLISGSTISAALDDQLSRRESADETSEFALSLVAKINSNHGAINKWLRTLVTGKWSVERLGTVEKVILTMSLAELRFSPDVPPRVAINEALELTRRYCDDDAVGFINAILDKAAADVVSDAAGGTSPGNG